MEKTSELVVFPLSLCFLCLANFDSWQAKPEKAELVDMLLAAVWFEKGA